MLNRSTIAEILLFCIAALALTISSFKFSQVEVHDKAGKIIANSFPVSGHTADLDSFTVKAKFQRPYFSDRLLKIIPDDCVEELKINEHVVPIKKIAPDSRCNWSTGFSFDASSYLQSGTNTLKLVVDNHGGPYSLEITDQLIQPWRLLLIIALSIISLRLYWRLLSYLSIITPCKIILLGGLALRIFYLSYTPYTERGHDVDAHLEYIFYIMKNWALPEPSSGWEFHQAPLYYIFGAMVYQLCEQLGIYQPYAPLQALSLLFFSIFLSAGAKIFTLVLKTSEPLIIATLLLAFWPAGVIHSVRIGNDPLLYCFSALSIYFVAKWWVNATLPDLYRAAFYAGFALLTKTSAVICVATVFTLMFIHVISIPERLRFMIKSSGVWIILIMCLGLNLVDNYLSLVRGLSQDWLASNSGANMHHGLITGNEIRHYILFDLKDFVSLPFADPWDQASGREYFWNYSLKTSLFGEFHFNQPLLIHLGLIMTSVLLLLMVCGVLGILRHLYIKQRNLVPLSLVMLFSFIFLMLFRIKIPAGNSADFRYILPIVIPFSVFVSYNFCASTGTGKFWRYSTWLVTAIFTAGSITFFIALGFNA